MKLCSCILSSLVAMAVSGYGYAQDRLHIVLVRGGTAGIGVSTLWQILSESEPALNRMGVITQKVSVIGDRWTKLNGYNSQTARLYRLSTYAERRKRRFRAGFNAVHFLVSPMALTGQGWLIGGLAWGCGRDSSRAYSMSNATLENARGQYSIAFSAMALAHEVGHTLGATHRDYTPNLMHSEALHFIPEGIYPLEILEESRQEMAACALRRNRFGKN